MPTTPGYADITIKLRHNLLSRQCALTWGVQPTATDPIQVCNQVGLAVTGATTLEGVMDNDVTIVGIRASLGTDGAADNVGEINTTLQCDGVYAAPPANCAVLVHKRTARGGRRGRGRLFVPWAISEGDVDEVGKISTSTVGALQTKFNNLLTQLTTNNVPMVLLHSEGQTPAGAPNLVTSLVVDPLISTQRRRLGR